MDLLSLLVGLIVILALAFAVTISLSFYKKGRLIQARANFLNSLKMITLAVSVPRENEKTPQAAEQMFSALHGILRQDPIQQEHFSFELVAEESSIKFFINLPVHLKDFITGQIYAHYPTVDISELENDYTDDLPDIGFAHASSNLALEKPDAYPIRTFESFEVDTQAGITAVLSQTGQGERVWLQYLLRPVDETWEKKAELEILKLKGEFKDTRLTLAGALKGFTAFLSDIATGFFSAGRNGERSENGGGGDPLAKLSGPAKLAIAGIEEKMTKLAFATIVRSISIANDETSARARLEALIGAFKQFNLTNLNGFKAEKISIGDSSAIEAYRKRSFPSGAGNIFTTSELASLYHYPATSVETPNIVWTGAKKGEPPSNLPVEGTVSTEALTVFAKTDFRARKERFGISLDDRRRHMYLIGKTGVGKSVLISNMALSDIYAGHGCCVVDPHGDLIETILQAIPSHRINDVILFDPSDRDFPIGFNLLEQVDEDLKGIVASGFVGIFKKIFGFSWGPRLEHILRNTVLALLDNENQTMLGIPKMLTDKRYRQEIVSNVRDPVIRDFWVNEFEQYDTKFRTEAVSPILNKVGQFLSTTTIRNIVGQVKSTVDMREVMDNRKILLINLTRGRIGEDNSALLGSMLVTKIQLSAMSRADIPEDQRVDFFLYVDEFQNFATESFAVILSEARKYRLNLVIAHQYIAQLPEEVRDSAFGNVGTIIAFRVGAADAAFMVKEFEPVFTENDLVNLEKYHIYIKLMINGVASPAFSAITLPPTEMTTDSREKIVVLAHAAYAKPRTSVEREIIDWSRRLEPELSPTDKAVEELMASRHQSKTNSSGQSSFEAARLNEKEGEKSSEERFNPADLIKAQSENEPTIGKAMINDVIYREVSQKGGLLWYVGEVGDDKAIASFQGIKLGLIPKERRTEIEKIKAASENKQAERLRSRAEQEVIKEQTERKDDDQPPTGSSGTGGNQDQTINRELIQKRLNRQGSSKPPDIGTSGGEADSGQEDKRENEREGKVVILKPNEVVSLRK